MNKDQITLLYQDLVPLEDTPAEAVAWLAIQEKNKEAKKSKYVHYSIVDMSGIFIQFISSQSINTMGTRDIFGGIWINLTNAERVPNYLDKYETTIRIIARKQLEAHLQRVNHLAGLNEQLTDEDFSMSFAWNTLLAAGLRAAHPSARKEGPIWYGLFPALIEPINVSRDPSNPGQWAHIINCYISLPNKQIQHSYLHQKKKDDYADNIKGTKMATSTLRKNVTWQPNQRKLPYQKRIKNNNQEWNGTDLQPVLNRIDRLGAKINDLKTPEQHYPVLPP